MSITEDKLEQLNKDFDRTINGNEIEDDKELTFIKSESIFDGIVGLSIILVMFALAIYIASFAFT